MVVAKIAKKIGYTSVARWPRGRRPSDWSKSGPHLPDDVICFQEY